MAVFIALIAGGLIARIAGWLGADYVDGWASAIAVGLAVMMLMTGGAHFAPGMRRDMIAIVPPRLPAPGLLVTITGVLEIAGAAGLLFPPTRMVAAICLFVLMSVMFPANVRAARMPNPPRSMTASLPIRTAEQALYLGAAVVVAIFAG